jgi:hypothetical protein
MRTIIAVCVVTLFAGGLAMWQATQLRTVFGQFTGAPETAVADLIGSPIHFAGKTVLVKGPVRQQCKAMGCFFFLHAGQKRLRVNLEEIAMKAPMKEGHQARVEGEIVRYRDTYQLLATAVAFE